MDCGNASGCLVAPEIFEDLKLIQQNHIAMLMVHSLITILIQL